VGVKLTKPSEGHGPAGHSNCKSPNDLGRKKVFLNVKMGQMRWCTPVVLATQEAGLGESLETKDNVVRPCLYKGKKKSQVFGFVLLILKQTGPCQGKTPASPWRTLGKGEKIMAFLRNR
jgi:hypothetical protein